jgi:hypothetical protein
MSYPKDMYVKVCGTRERASIRVLGYMYIIYIREYIYDGNVLVSVPFSREDVLSARTIKTSDLREGPY